MKTKISYTKEWNPTDLKLGKLEATHDPRDLMMAKYFDFAGAPLPKAPQVFGHFNDVKVPWGMLANDRFGCCVPAAFAHLLMQWRSMWKRDLIKITDAEVLIAYHEITEIMNPGNGFDPSKPETDTGCNMRIAMNWFRTVGFPDADGNRHKLFAFGGIDGSDNEMLMTCANLFDGVDIGFRVTQDCMNRFHNGQPWDVPFFGSPVVGGHSIPIIGRKNYQDAVSWGALHGGTKRFFNKYIDEAWVLISEEMIDSGKTPEGFDLNALQKDLDSVSN